MSSVSIVQGGWPPGTPEGDFAYWWRLAGEWVEPPNERRNGWSGMLRTRHEGRTVYVKRQRNHLCRSLRHPFGWPTASREWYFLYTLRALGVRVPAPLFHATRQGDGAVESLLVTEELTGFAPLSAQHELSADRRRRLAVQVGAALAPMHRARLQHSCLYDKHIMVRWSDDGAEIALLDLEKMRRRLSRRAAARHDLDQLCRHQRLWPQDEWHLLVASHAAGLADIGPHRG